MYQPVLDIWEADERKIDHKTLSKFFKGMIIRLNDINGGHHLDTGLPENWEDAKNFYPAQSIYFVFNPWVNYLVNYEFVNKWLPDDYGNRMVFIDIEVKYSGITKEQYANEVYEFIEKMKKERPTTIYTGMWFLDKLSYWRKDVPYWWACYIPELYPKNDTMYASHNKLMEIMDAYKEPYNRNLVPGSLLGTQITGDRVITEGSNGRVVDVSHFPYSEEQLVKLMNNGEVITEPDPDNPDDPIGDITMPITDNARALYIEGKIAAKDTLKKFDVLIAKNDKFIHDNVQVAYDAGVPCIVFYPIKVDPYINCGYNVDSFPKPDKDWNIKELDNLIYYNGDVKAGKKRAIHGIMFDCSQVRQDNGNKLTAGWLSTVCIYIADMAKSRYSKSNIYICLYQDSNPMKEIPVTQSDKETIGLVSEWGDFATVNQVTVNPLTDYPLLVVKPKLPWDNGKTKWIAWLYSIGTNWKFMFNGTKDAIYKKLSFTTANPDPVDPEPEPTEQEPQTTAGKIDELWKWYKEQTGKYKS